MAGHHLLQRRASLYVPDWVTETRGWTGSVSSTSNAYENKQTTSFYTPVDLTVSSLIWRGIRRPADYTLRIDGIEIATKTVTSNNDPGREMLSAPITVTAGMHTFELTKTGGSSGWYYVSSRALQDGLWFHTSHWVEAAGLEIVPMSMTATFDAAAAADRALPNPSANYSTTSRTTHTWIQTFKQRTEVYAIRMGGGGVPSTYELLVDGVVAATSPLWESQTSLGQRHRVVAVVDRVFEADVPYVMTWRRSNLTAFEWVDYVPGGVAVEDSFQRVDPHPSDGEAWIPVWVVRKRQYL